jgi:hypothetical protein
MLQYIWGTGGLAPPFLTSALDGGEWIGSRPGAFTPVQESPVLIGLVTEWAPEPV